MPTSVQEDGLLVILSLEFLEKFRKDGLSCLSVRCGGAGKVQLKKWY